MRKTIATTIRWTPEELEQVKAASAYVGLPTALFVKNMAMKEVRSIQDKYPQDKSLARPANDHMQDIVTELLGELGQ